MNPSVEKLLAIIESLGLKIVRGNERGSLRISGDKSAMTPLMLQTLKEFRKDIEAIYWPQETTTTESTPSPEGNDSSQVIPDTTTHEPCRETCKQCKAKVNPSLMVGTMGLCEMPSRCPYQATKSDDGSEHGVVVGNRLPAPTAHQEHMGKPNLLKSKSSSGRKRTSGGGNLWSESKPG